MIYILAYLLPAVSTFTWTWFATKGNEDRLQTAIVFGLMWPLIWISFIVQLLRNRFPSATCAWCGKTVAPLSGKMDVWKNHYLTECEKHPLAIEVKRLRGLLNGVLDVYDWGVSADLHQETCPVWSQGEGNAICTCGAEKAIEDARVELGRKANWLDDDDPELEGIEEIKPFTEADWNKIVATYPYLHRPDQSETDAVTATDPQEATHE